MSKNNLGEFKFKVAGIVINLEVNGCLDDLSRDQTNALEVLHTRVRIGAKALEDKYKIYSAKTYFNKHGGVIGISKKEKWVENSNIKILTKSKEGWNERFTVHIGGKKDNYSVIDAFKKAVDIIADRKEFTRDMGDIKNMMYDAFDAHSSDIGSEERARLLDRVNQFTNPDMSNDISELVVELNGHINIFEASLTR